MDLFKDLNEPQIEAVNCTEGPLLILAGAGSGKTRVLTHRIAYMVSEKGVKPSNILAITFTNKAAKEMRKRVDNLVGEKSSDIWVSTFHSTCMRILRREIEKVGFGRNFVIFDTADQKVVVKDCLKMLNLSENNFPIKYILDVIGRAKDELLDAKTYEKRYASDFRMSKIASIYSLYQKKLKENNALDFDDIINYTVKLFNDNPLVLDYYQNKFKYILVDEYQDTNTAQYVLISLLAHKNKNLCVVGDDDQSIYAWRGANIRNILDFEKEFKDCKVIRLEQNYRSTQTILNVANSVIKNNEGRKDKSLWTQNNEGSNVFYYEAENEHLEAAFVVSEIIKNCEEDNRKHNEFVVLYRMNAQSRVLEEKFMSEKIPYKIFGGQKFYDRKEIKDIIAYLRIVSNHSDNVSLKRIINVPKRGIGESTVSHIENIANQKNAAMFSIISDLEEHSELKKASVKLAEFAKMISQFKKLSNEIKISELISIIIEKSGMLKEYENEKTVEADSRIENIKEFITAALEYEAVEQEEYSLEDFLSNISLVSDIDNLAEEDNYVALMTMHNAKGLEYPIVFMVGMEDGVFPGYRSMTSEPKQMEEERRLCYVAITRAKEKVYLTGTKCRTLFGSTKYNRKSKFLYEIPGKYIEETTFASFAKPLFTSNKIDLESFKTVERFFEEKKVMKDIDFKVGDKVEHKKFGVGIVKKIEKESDDYKVEIKFENFGMKRLMAAYAELKIIS